MICNWNKEYTQNAGEHSNFNRNVVNWIEQDYTSSETCFVYVENSVIKGGIAYAIVDQDRANILDFL